MDLRVAMSAFGPAPELVGWANLKELLQIISVNELDVVPIRICHSVAGKTTRGYDHQAIVAPIVGSRTIKFSRDFHPDRNRPALALDKPILDLTRFQFPSQYVDPPVARRATMQSVESKMFKQRCNIFFEFKPL